MLSCGGCEMWDVVCSFVHEGYLTRAHIHKELCNHTPNEVSPPLIQSDPQPTFACLTREHIMGGIWVI